MIDLTIEKALAPDKPDWKMPLWAKFKSYAVGFGAALLVVGAIVAAIAYFAPPIAPQTEPTMTAYPLPQVAAKAPTQKLAKVATEKIAAQAINTPSMPIFEVEKSIEIVEAKQAKKPRIKDEFNAEFDKEQNKFETNLKKDFP